MRVQPSREAGGTLVLLTIKHHVFVDLVADQQSLGRFEQRFKLLHFSRSPDRATRVVWRVDDDGAGLGVMAAAILAKSGRNVPGVNGTRTAMPPANSMLGT